MICNTDGALFIFRRPIISHLIDVGFSVASISSKSQYFGSLSSIGVEVHELEFSRHSISPLRLGQLLINLKRCISRIRPDIVHNFTHIPAIYGSIAAKLAGTDGIFVTVTGLGTLFSHSDFKTRVLRELLILQYRVAMRYVDTVFFQNPDDLSYFLQRNIVRTEQACLTGGSGIDLVEFSRPSNESRLIARAMLSIELAKDLSQRQVVLFPARGVPEKGFFVYYQAAKVLTESYPNRFIFLHLGLIDEAATYGHITHDRTKSFADQCSVHHLGYKENIKDYMIASDIVALPSYYREGTPRSLIEALALGLTIVTTDSPGCRETVIDGWNGYLCEPRSADSLAEQLEKATPAFCAMSGDRSRSLCEEKFDAIQVVQATLDRYGLESVNS